MTPRIRLLAFLAIGLAAAPVAAQDEEAHVSHHDGPPSEVYRYPKPPTNGAADVGGRTPASRVQTPLPFFLQLDECVGAGPQTTARVYYASTYQTLYVRPDGSHCRLPPVEARGALEEWLRRAKELFENEEPLRVPLGIPLGGYMDQLLSESAPTLELGIARVDPSFAPPPDSTVSLLFPREAPAAFTMQQRPLVVGIANNDLSTYGIQVLEVDDGMYQIVGMAADTVFSESPGIISYSAPPFAEGRVYFVQLSDEAGTPVDAWVLRPAPPDLRARVRAGVDSVRTVYEAEPENLEQKTGEPHVEVLVADYLIEAGFGFDAVASISKALEQTPTDPALRSAFHTLIRMYQAPLGEVGDMDEE